MLVWIWFISVSCGEYARGGTDVLFYGTKEARYGIDGGRRHEDGR